MSSNPPNAQQATYWADVGGPNWVRQQRQFDHMLANFGREALQALGPVAGEHIVDIGCGTGTSTMALAEAVTTAGRVVGLDISPTMLDAARERARSYSNVSFVLADAQVDPLIVAESGDQPFDGAFSRFGVMFFEDPVAAFENVAAGLRPGGRLAFACWRNEEFNPWIDLAAQIMRRHTPEPVYPPLHAPGPFGFQDGERLHAILDRAGWAAIDLRDFSAEVTMGEGLGIEPAMTQMMATMVGQTLRAQVDDAAFDAAAIEIRAMLEAHVRDGAVVFPGSVWIVTATRP